MGVVSRFARSRKIEFDLAPLGLGSSTSNARVNNILSLQLECRPIEADWLSRLNRVRCIEREPSG
jgi:hypothetical protein